jgi:hypothetical protein
LFADKLSEATKAIKELHGHISAQWQGQFSSFLENNFVARL